MRDRLDVAVIGSGVTGAATAYFLARSGRAVALIDRGVPGGQGASRYAGAIVRAYDPDPVWRALGALGARELAQWKRSRMPGPSPMCTRGFVYLASAESADRAEAGARELSTPEYPIELLTPLQLRRRLPWLRAERGPVALYERDGGVADPRSTANLLAAGTRALGGRLLPNCSVAALEPGGDGWRLRLPAGVLSARTVVVASGAWRALVPEAPIYVRTIPLLEFASERAFRFAVVDETASTYLVPKAGGFYAGSQAVEVRESAERADGALAPAAVADGEARLRALLPDSEPRRLINGFTGFDGYSEDQRPLIGAAPGRPGVYLATGFSGRGYKCCLAVGRLIAAELNGEALTDDQTRLLAALRPDRFAQPARRLAS
jgi:glycine/D-amino acid oxidase-like deaminating enzyme